VPATPQGGAVNLGPAQQGRVTGGGTVFPRYEHWAPHRNTTTQVSACFDSPQGGSGCMNSITITAANKCSLRGEIV